MDVCVCISIALSLSLSLSLSMCVCVCVGLETRTEDLTPQSRMLLQTKGGGGYMPTKGRILYDFDDPDIENQYQVNFYTFIFIVLKRFLNYYLNY